MNIQKLLQTQQEFQQQEQTLTSGYLVLIDTQIIHLASRKEWETTRLNYPRHRFQFLAVDLEKWRKRFEKEVF